MIILGAVTVVLALHYTRQCTGRVGFDFKKRGRNDCRTTYIVGARPSEIQNTERGRENRFVKVRKGAVLETHANMRGAGEMRVL